jgi:hypothetical protein
LRAEKWSGCTWLIHLKIDKLTLNTAFIKKTTQLERTVARRQILRKSLKKKKQHFFKIEIISLLTMKLQKFEGYRTRKNFPCHLNVTKINVKLSPISLKKCVNLTQSSVKRSNFSLSPLNYLCFCTVRIGGITIQKRIDESRSFYSHVKLKQFLGGSCHFLGGFFAMWRQQKLTASKIRET